MSALTRKEKKYRYILYRRKIYCKQAFTGANNKSLYCCNSNISFFYLQCYVHLTPDPLSFARRGGSGHIRNDKTRDVISRNEVTRNLVDSARKDFSPLMGFEMTNGVRWVRNYKWQCSTLFSCTTNIMSYPIFYYLK